MEHEYRDEIFPGGEKAGGEVDNDLFVTAEEGETREQGAGRAERIIRLLQLRRSARFLSQNRNMVRPKFGGRGLEAQIWMICLFSIGKVFEYLVNQCPIKEGMNALVPEFF